MYNRLYYLKKSFALYPGTTAPVSAPFLADHYRVRRQKRSALRAGLDWLIGKAFLSWIPWRARKIAKRFGFDDAWVEKAVRISRERFADPWDIALFRIERPEDLDLYLRQFENAGISKIINPNNWRDDCVLANKISFARRCAEHGIRQPTLLATVEDGTATVYATPSAKAVILKPAFGEGGSGVSVIEVPDEALTDSGAFGRFVTEKATGLKGPWMVQPRLVNHPAMADITLNALATVRLSTILDDHGEPRVFSTVLRFASRPDALADNFKAGGMMAPIDPGTGTLGLACTGRDNRDFALHPHTSAPIQGLTLPHWEEAIALAKQAHRQALPEYTVIGWDIALTGDGPYLLEGNGKPGLIVGQCGARQGLGATPFGEWVRYHLSKADRLG